MNAQLLQTPRLDYLQTAINALDNKIQRGSGSDAFVARVEALDVLENYALELAEPGLDSTLDKTRRVLQQRVTALHEEWQRINGQAFRNYRSLIAAGRIDAAALIKEFSSYTAGGFLGTNDNLQYDALDILIGGILHEVDFAESGLTLEPEMVGYQPTPARAILEVMRQVNIEKHDVFYDIGSGLGHVPILISLLSGAAAVGIEVQPSHCKHAQQCAARLRLKNVRFICRDARAADYSSGTIFYLYTPFRGSILHEVLMKLRLEAQSREIFVCTYGPYLQEAMAESLSSVFERINKDSPIAVFESKR